MPIPDIIEVQIPGIRGIPGASTAEAEAAAAAAVAAKTAAETAEANAEAAATNAASSASAAATSATNASNSATTASTAATNAETAEDTAVAAAGSASGSAGAAAGSASAAATSATNADNSATAAAGSASAAATSATNADNSATAAANSAASASTDAQRAEDAAEALEEIVDFDPDDYLDKATYDTDEDGKVNSAEVADAAPWAGITDKPTTLAGYGITDGATSDQGALADTAVQPGDIGTAAAEDVGFFATAAQGALADTAVQPGDLGTAAAQDVEDFASAAQGALADTAVQPGDIGTAAVADSTDFATAAQGAKADTAVQPGDFHAASAKASPVDDDEMSLWDSAASWILKKWTIGNLKTLINGLIATYVAAQDVEALKGAIDCSANPNYPVADAGHVYRVSVAGKIGGASGVNVEAGDRLECFTDGTSSGDHATVGANWMVSQVNIDGAVIGPTSAVDSVPPLYDGTSGRLLKSAGSLSAWRTAVGLAIGSAVQAYSGVLDSWAAKTPPSGSVVGTTDTQTLSGKTLDGATHNNAITVESHAFNTSTNAAVDLANGVLQIPTLTGNWVPASGWPTATAGQGFRMILKTGTGGYTVTWPSAVKWAAGVAPTISSAASKADIIDFESDGTNWYGYVVGQAYVP